ncbi:hypothetical protein HYDPIDRAFT_40580 [Hydnomerulius pinastri MD-312]|uniref:Unplaced genomic scaffold scaffold_13, whole genome shotgun sequence n=1 Tax=Hydnomerulius pinastri MD-312 TaxID=994086 RepID=A0A0C9VFP3_9AGAM|nr:hypothetical protein HYDPIDRAFT_40580 [Hydnomerulius pinastri MD-312]
MNGSILRQRLGGSDVHLKSPVGVKLGPTTEQEYLSDSAYDRFQKSKSTLIHGDEVSSPSQYESGSDTGAESDGAAVVSPSQEGRSSSRTPSAASTPPLQSPSRNGEDTLEAASNRAWYEFDLSVVIALVSPIGNWLTGGDHVKNILLILLLIFYLHQIIEVPWSLYLMSRPRRGAAPDKDASVEGRYHRVASTELRSLELFYLSLTVLSPFLGALLLRTVIVTVSGPTTISWFSTSLFVLATGMRPWKHAVERLRERTTDLHDVIHYPPSEAQKTQLQLEALVERLAQVEAELKASKNQLESFTTEIYEHVEDAIDVVEKTARKQEKKTEVAKSAHETRLMKLEQSVEALLERKEIRADGPTFYGSVTRASTFLSALTDQVYPILPGWASLKDEGPPSPRSSPKSGRSRAASKLETIPEVSTFQPKSSRQPFSSLRIPGLGLVLRIGDLATLPVRRVVAYLLAGRIYTPSRAVSPL